MVNDVALSSTESAHTSHAHVQGGTDNVHIILLQMVCVCECDASVSVCVCECECEHE